MEIVHSNDEVEGSDEEDDIGVEDREIEVTVEVGRAKVEEVGKVGAERTESSIWLWRM